MKTVKAWAQQFRDSKAMTVEELVDSVRTELQQFLSERLRETARQHGRAGGPHRRCFEIAADLVQSQVKS